MATDIQSFDADILTDVVAPNDATLDPPIARALLRWQFSPTAVSRMHELADKNRRDALTPEERAQFDSFLRIGQFLNLVHAKARLSLSGHESLTH